MVCLVLGSELDQHAVHKPLNLKLQCTKALAAFNRTWVVPIRMPCAEADTSQDLQPRKHALAEPDNSHAPGLPTSCLHGCAARSG